MPLDVVGIGSQLGIDFIGTPEGVKEFPGGNVANSLVVLQSLGLRTGYIGLVGTDQYTQRILKDLTEGGIDVSRIRRVSSPSPVCRIKIVKGDRILTFTGEKKKLEDFPEEDKAYLRTSRSAFLRASYLLAKEYANFAKQNGLEVFLSMHNTNPGGNFSFLEDIDFDALFANEKEVKGIRSIDNLTAKGAEVIITKGDKGCSVYNSSGRIDFPARRIYPLDPTGAGDAFAAGYMYGYLNGWKLERRAEFANAVGAMATLQYGGRLRVRPEQVLEFIGRSKS